MGVERGVETPICASPLPEAAFSNPDVNDAIDAGIAGDILEGTFGADGIAPLICGGVVPVSSEYRSFQYFFVFASTASFPSWPFSS